MFVLFIYLSFFCYFCFFFVLTTFFEKMSFWAFFDLETIGKRSGVANCVG